MGEGGIKNNREASTFFFKHALSIPPTTQATEGRIQGEKGRRPNAGGESTTNIGILKGLYCLPATISVPATCWALQDSPTNPEDLGMWPQFSSLLPGDQGISWGRQCGRGPQSEGQRAEQHSLWRRMGERALLDAHHGGMSRREGQGGVILRGNDTRGKEHN